MTKGGTEREGYSREGGQTSSGGGHPLPFVGSGFVRRSPAVVGSSPSVGACCSWVGGRCRRPWVRVSSFVGGPSSFVGEACLCLADGGAVVVHGRSLSLVDGRGGGE
jgi:hypothetical protein